MSSDLRELLKSVDPARDVRGYHRERQLQITNRIVASDTDDVAPRTEARFGRLLGAVAAAAVIVVTAVGVHSTSARNDTAAPAPTDVVQRLDRIARIAAVQPALVPDQDQYFYTRMVQAGAEVTADAHGGYTVYGPLPALLARETWASQDPTRPGYFIEGKVKSVINPPLGGASSADLTYAQIAALPTDPATLLQQVKANLPAGYRDDENQGTFAVTLGYLAVGPPPAVASALYRAASLIPGVKVAPDAVDAVGRHGVGLYYDDSSATIRDQYIIDPRTAKYLGSDEYLLKPGRRGDTGTHVATAALLATGVVDRAGHRP